MFKTAINNAVLVIKTTKNFGMIRNIIDSICNKKHNQHFALLFYSNTHWWSINDMFRHLKEVMSEIGLTPRTLLHERGGGE